MGAAVVQRLRSPDLPHAFFETAIRRQKMRTIVPHFHLEVVIFLFYGRNSGQTIEASREKRQSMGSGSCYESGAETAPARFRSHLGMSQLLKG
jgi:hypothetical protein